MTKSARRASKRAGANDRQKTVRKRPSLKANALYQELFASSPDGILLIDAETQRVVEFNDAACRQLGYTREEFARLRISDYEASETPEEVAEHVQKALREGKTEFDTLQRTKTGEIRHVHVWAKAFDLDGRVVFYAIFRDITERRRAEETLEKVEADYRLLAEHSPDLIARFDTRLRHLYVNPAAARAGKLSASDYIGLTIAETGVPEPLATTWNQRIEQVLKTRRILDVEDAFPTPQGTRYFHARLVPELAPDGSVCSVLSLARDVTERKRAEEALRESEHEAFDALEFNRTIVSTSSIGILTYKKSGQCVSANAAASKVGGGTVAQLLAQNFHEVLSWKKSGMYQAAIRALDTGIEQLLEIRLVSTFGKDVWLSLSFSSFDSAGERHLLVFTFDITARKRAEEALRESELNYRTLFEQSPDAVVVLDPETTLPVDFNDEACRRLGYSREEFARLRIADHDADHTPAEIQASISEILAKGTAAFEARHHTKQGDVRNVWISVRVLETGGQTVCYSISRDITRRKRAQERMQTFSREIIAAREDERKQVSSVLHHDVGSLAVGVSAHLDAIEEDLRSGKPGEALKWTKRTRKLFNVSVARLKEVAVQLRPSELDVLGLCAALRQYFSQATKHGRTRIYFRETLGRRRVSGDTATTLFRVAQETLTNAITHGDAKQVDVFLSASEKEVRLTVRDHGKGFSPSEQTGRATSRMGLRVMKEMAASAGGGFKIYSRRGKGTTVRVSLPLTTAALGRGDITVREETVARGKTTRSAGRGSRPQTGRGA